MMGQINNGRKVAASGGMKHYLSLPERFDSFFLHKDSQALK